MDLHPTPDLTDLRIRATDAVRLLSLLANENRLMVLCHLAGRREMTVGALAGAIGLSQPALSQHLARLRDDGMVATRRESQAVYYRLTDTRTQAILTTLRDLFCHNPGEPVASANAAAQAAGSTAPAIRSKQTGSWA